MPLANNPHPKDLNKSPALAGFFVCGIRSSFYIRKIDDNEKIKGFER